MAARLFDEPEHHAQAQAATLSDLLGREEGVEGALDDLGRHARSRVGDRDHEVYARRHILDLGRVFLIDRDGIVRWRFIETNHRVRAENAMILEALADLD